MKHLKNIKKHPMIFLLMAIALCAFVSTISAAGNMEDGKKIYDRNCMECHHTDGMGILAPPFVESTRFKSMDGVVAMIDYIMPAMSPDLCTGTRVEDVADYIPGSRSITQSIDRKNNMIFFIPIHPGP